MKETIINKAVSDIESQLKGFQTASVEYVMNQYYKEGRNKVMIADEVGLGKTIIAKGVVTKSIQKTAGSINKPFHVVYICSNQILAQQNISKLNPFGTNPRPLSRLVYLALKSTDSTSDDILRLSSLTPSTSFELKRGEGNYHERAILYNLLIQDARINGMGNSLLKFLKSNRQGEERWKQKIEQYSYANETYRESCQPAFIARLKQVCIDKAKFPHCSDILDRDDLSIYDSLCIILDKREAADFNSINYRYELVRAMRSELTFVCLKYLEADLFILDEFQRFKNLLDSSEESEAGEIAKIVLQNDQTKVLLLSATPFKPYTTNIEQLDGEEHSVELERIVKFLGGSKGDLLWTNFKKDQQRFFDLIRHPQKVIENSDFSLEVKHDLESSFKKFLSRNERLNYVKEYSNMTKEVEQPWISVISEDIKNFISIDQLLNKIKDNHGSTDFRIGSAMEYVKTAPFPLSFLHGYKLKEVIDDLRTDPIVQRHLNESGNTLLKYTDINTYKPLSKNSKVASAFPNGKMRMLANECFDNEAELLLWMPASKPYYHATGVFQDNNDFSKILIFSSWSMAPRAISNLLSYEVERRTIAKVKLDTTNEQGGRRSYFEQPRRPKPVLLFSTKKISSGIAYHMSNYCLVYPSKVLCEHSFLKDLDSFELSYSQVQAKQMERIAALIEEASLIENYGDTNISREDKTWYWIVGPLLDFHADCFYVPIMPDSASEGMRQHNLNLKTTIDDLVSGSKKLGRIPEDLLEVVSDIALASPANAAYYSLCQFFDSEYAVQVAFEVGFSFVGLFNKPESISAIRLAVPDESEHWRKIVRYCVSGNLASVLEEYIYLLYHGNSKKSIEDVKESLLQVLSVKTSNINVDLQEDTFYSTHNMRTHFAVAYGNQKMDTESGANRMIGVRDVFNSPFRPFVLASTSIGQEGLDFHYYCRKIFHWNLPSNAIDIEQREGRINRFKGLVVRKRIVESLTDKDILANKRKGTDLWTAIFSAIESKYKEDESGIMPFWYLHKGETCIERFVPVHKFSKDRSRYDNIRKTLALYRMTFGQPRQEELIAAYKDSNLSRKEMQWIREHLLIDLSPRSFS